MTTIRLALQWIALSISSTFFSGFIGKLFNKPGKAGGSAGAAVALITQMFLLNEHWSVPAGIAALSFMVGLLVIGPAERLMLAKWGSRKRHTGEESTCDFNETNIDEFHGQFFAALPVWFLDASLQLRIACLVGAFVVFRIFDSSKPWPIKQIEARFHGTAFGIMIDDTAAALPSVLICCVPLLVQYL